MHISNRFRRCCSARKPDDAPSWDRSRSPGSTFDKAGLHNLKISVITAVYNNRDTIAHALDSALAQDHPHVELLVIDGGSAYGDLLYVSKDDPSRVVRTWRAAAFTLAKLARGWMPPHPTLYVRRSVYEQRGKFDTSFRIAADYDFILRLLSRDGIGVKYISEVLVKMRVGGASNRSLRNIVKKSSEDLRALRRNGVGGVGALLWKNLSKLPQFLK